MLRTGLLCCLLLAPGLVTAFTLEAVLSAPYVTRLVAAGDAPRLAWVTEVRGARNVFTAAGPAFEPVQLTSYAADDGRTISALALTPDGRHALYVHGGGPNRAGEYPNPASLPRAQKPVLCIVSTAGGAPRVLAEEALGIELAPDGETVLFTREGTLYRVALAPAPTAPADAAPVGAADDRARPEAQPLFRVRGRTRGVRWSPDGKRVLFESERGDHSFIGVYDLEAERIDWVAPDVDRDYAAVWSPDGRQVAFFRRPGARRFEVPDLTAGWPFALWVADLVSGEAREIWRSPGEDGGFAHFYPAEPLRWTGGDRLLFTSEHEGWLHVYSIAPDGTGLVDLTPGAAEAESTAVTRDGGTLIYSGNFDDPNARQLYAVPVTGGEPERLTTGGAIETDPVVLGEHLAWRSGDARRPQGVALAGLDGSDRRPLFPTTLPEIFPADTLVQPRNVTFEASDGVTVHGQLFEPPGGAEGPRAALIFMHGGPIRQMLPGFHYRGYYAKTYAMNQYLAHRGFVVLAVNFRAGIGYGRAFRMAEAQGPRGAAEYKDILAAAEYLQGLPRVDDERIGLWGGSYGGYLTALGLARDSQLFAAGVDLHGVHDWSFRATDFGPGGYWGLLGEAALEQAVAASPVADVSFWTSPVLFIHGDDDRNVLFAQTTDLVQRLRDRNVTVETLVFPDEVHGFLRYESWLRAFEATAGFFERRLAPGPEQAPVSHRDPRQLLHDSG